jgi:hypothetical protein
MGYSKRNTGGGRMRRGVGGKLVFFWPLRHKGLCDTQETAKIGAVSTTTWQFGPEELVKTKFIIIYCKKSFLNLLKKLKSLH